MKIKWIRYGMLLELGSVNERSAKYDKVLILHRGKKIQQTTKEGMNCQIK